MMNDDEPDATENPWLADAFLALSLGEALRPLRTHLAFDLAMNVLPVFLARSARKGEVASHVRVVQALAPEDSLREALAREVDGWIDEIDPDGPPAEVSAAVNAGLALSSAFAGQLTNVAYFARAVAREVGREVQEVAFQEARLREYLRCGEGARHDRRGSSPHLRPH